MLAAAEVRASARQLAGLGALGRAPLVEHEHLLDANHLGAGGGEGDGLVGAGGLPVARAGGAVGANAVGILTVPGAEEVPLTLPMEDKAGVASRRWAI